MIFGQFNVSDHRKKMHSRSISFIYVFMCVFYFFKYVFF